MAENKIQRLYLAKGDKEEDNIYIDAVCLPQHQYDGIRFLYRQFKKGKPGVILNDPSGCGKRVQTVLFLSALRPIMTLPMLVLCTEGIEEVWRQQFHKWTKMGSVVIQKESHTKSMCVIGTLAQINLLCSREWGVLVVDDESVSKEALRACFNAKYRIWLTSLDMKKNLQKFSLIYKWLYPKDKFVIEDFQADKKPLAVYSNSVRLDTFMEDIVIRRRDAAVPPGKLCDTPNGVKQVSRKNKDATGRKIKRSKPLPDEEQETNSEHNNSRKLEYNGEIIDKKRSSDNFVNDVENDEEFKINDVDTDDKMTNVTSSPALSGSIIKFGDNGQERTEMDIDINPDINKVPRYDSIPKSDTQDSFIILNDNFIHSENIVIKYDSETQDDEVESDIPAKKTKFSNEMNVSEDLFSSDVIPSDIISHNINNHDNNTKTNENNIDIDDILTQAY